MNNIVKVKKFGSSEKFFRATIALRKINYYIYITIME